MRVVFCWSHVSGYMAACWRALAGRPGVDVHILAFKSGAATAPVKNPGESAGDKLTGGANAAFREDIVAGLNCRLLEPAERDDESLVVSLVRELKPDVIVIAGWFHGPYKRLATDPVLRNVPRVMGMDTPLRGPSGTWIDTLKQRLARLRFGSYLQGMSAVVVAGERAWQYARILGLPESRIVRGVYGFDYDAFSQLHARRIQQPDGWPRRFLYLGRYEMMKGVDVLLDAHARYRAAAEADAWPLTCCGMGPLRGEIARAAETAPGQIEDRGFVQPADQPEIMLASGAYVIASRYEPWGVAICEAGAAGLPLICTEACGAAVENVRSFHNGLTVATGDAAALAAAMRWVHHHADLMPEWGRRSQSLVAAFSAQRWADRWEAILFQAADQPSRQTPAT